MPKLICIILLFVFISGCGRKPQESASVREDLPEILQSKELRVLTLYSSTSYFLYRGEEMGYEFELARRFALSQGLHIKVIVAENISRLIEMLEDGEGDIAAYTLPVTNELRQRLIYCGEEVVTHQVLIQRRGNKEEIIDDVTGLVGKDIYVERDSKFDDRITHLDEELGGGIHIHKINKDTVTTEDLIGMVASGEIPYTLADDNIARLNKTYYNNLDIRLEVSFPQRSSWAVRKSSPLLAEAVDKWFDENHNSTEYKSILKRYFEDSKRPYTQQILSLSKGQISIYDPLFKKYAKELDWDWRLIASQAYQESQFDTTAVSWAGARGLMQLMPSTAKAYGLEIEKIQNPEENLKAAVKSMKALNKSFSKIEDRDERIKFILAAYNSGIGHIYDAMALAEKYNKNPLVWDGNVAEFVLLKSNPEFFNDSICKFGYIRGRETVNYVKDVLSVYNEYKTKIKP